MGKGLYLILTFLAAGIGALIGRRLKLPASMMVGSMMGAAVFNIATQAAYFPSDLRSAVQILTGIFIGLNFQREEINELRKLLVPTIILMIGMVIFNLCTGFFLYNFGNLDFITAFFSSAPGGATDIALIADEMGADTSYVALLQLSRIVIVILIYPHVFRVLSIRGWKIGAVNVTENKNEQSPETDAVNETRNETKNEMKNEQLSKEKIDKILLTLLAAAAGGLAFRMLGIPAGALIGSIFASALLNIFTSRAYLPVKCRNYIKIAAGAYIGARINVDAAVLLNLAVPFIIMLTGIIIFPGIIGIIIHAVTGLDLGICLMASTPAGMQEIVLMADDLGVEAPKVAIMHFIRIVVVITYFPIMIRWLTMCF